MIKSEIAHRHLMMMMMLLMLMMTLMKMHPILSMMRPIVRTLKTTTIVCTLIRCLQLVSRKYGDMPSNASIGFIYF